LFEIVLKFKVIKGMTGKIKCKFGCPSHSRGRVAWFLDIISGTELAADREQRGGRTVL